MQNNIYIISRSNPEELYHHGVKGMKWGHRKASHTGVGNAFKSLTDPTAHVKKDGYQKSRNQIVTTISKDGYHKTKMPGGTRSDKKYNRELKKYNKAKELSVMSSFLSETYNQPGIKPSIRSNKSAQAAKYKRKADKILNSLSEETMSRIQSEEKKAQLERAKRYAEQRTAFHEHMKSVMNESGHGDTSRHPGL